jgi:hypothetical protein
MRGLKKVTSLSLGPPSAPGEMTAGFRVAGFWRHRSPLPEGLCLRPGVFVPQVAMAFVPDIDGHASS